MTFWFFHSLHHHHTHHFSNDPWASQRLRVRLWMRICHRNCTSQRTSVASISSGRSLQRKSPETRVKSTEWASACCSPVSFIERNVQVWTFLPAIYSTYYAVLPFLSGAPDLAKAQGLNHRTALVALLQVSVVLHSPCYSPPDSLSQWIWMTRCV